MRRGAPGDEPIPWEQLTREAYGRAMHHRFKGEVGYAEAEERFAVWKPTPRFGLPRKGRSFSDWERPCISCLNPGPFSTPENLTFPG